VIAVPHGIVVQADALAVRNTSDGVDINVIWGEVAALLQAWNSESNAVVSLLSFQTTDPASLVAQSLQVESMQESSEFGVPKAVALPPAWLKCGNTFRDYDVASRLSYRFIRDSTAEAVRGQITRLFESDAQLTNGLVLNRLFSPVEQANEWQHRCFGLYNGTDGIIPPSFMGHTYTATHSHYWASGAADLDSADLEDAYKDIQSHGYGVQPGSQLLVLCHQDEGEAIASWRAGVESRAGGPKARFDFVPSDGHPPILTSESIVGQAPPTEYGGLRVQGAYGPGWVIQSPVVPSGYVVVLASGGPNSTANPVAFRHHANANYQGLQLMPGPIPGYPLQETFAVRGCGVGTRHRGAAVAIQVTTGATYTAPVIPV